MTEPLDDRDKPTPDWKRPAEPPIHRAARKGDLAALASLIASGKDINTRADLEFDNGPHLRGLTTLMVAARSIDGASVQTLKWLVEHGADTRARSEGGNTAAWYAAGLGGRWDFHERATTPDHVERLRYLLALGLDPNECNFIGRSLMTEACEAGDPARVGLLLERGVSPIAAAASPRRTSIAERMAPGLAEEMLDRQRTVPRGTADSYQIPLHCAARSGSGVCVRLILEAGADVNTRDVYGETALMVAGSPEVARALLAAFADLNAADEFGKDVLAKVLEGGCGSGSCGSDRFGIARVLIEAGADIEQVGPFGTSRLASAAFGHQADAVEFLLSLGANANSLDAEGGNPLHSICWQGQYQQEGTNHACERIIRSLARAGTKLDAARSDGAAPLHEAASGDWGNQTAIRTLLDLGARVDPRDEQGNTPLMLAAMRGEVECIRALLEAGADPSAKNAEGLSAIAVAKQNLESWEETSSNRAGEMDEMLKDMEATVAASVAEELGTTAPSMPELAKWSDIQDRALSDARESLAMLLAAASRRA